MRCDCQIPLKETRVSHLNKTQSESEKQGRTPACSETWRRAFIWALSEEQPSEGGEMMQRRATGGTSCLPQLHMMQTLEQVSWSFSHTQWCSDDLQHRNAPPWGTTVPSQGRVWTGPEHLPSVCFCFYRKIVFIFLHEAQKPRRKRLDQSLSSQGSDGAAGAAKLDPQICYFFLLQWAEIVI